MTNRPQTINSKDRLRAWTGKQRAAGRTIALVPTMGALHEGHLSLVDIAVEKADCVIVSIFVNPAQFAPHEDFNEYPRDIKGDLEKLKEHGADLVYMPDMGEMYPQGFSTKVEVGGLAECLCGVTRPHFFGGVATVVTKLLVQTLPDFAVFGEKDYQQLLVIRRLARDLDLPVEIIGGPIIRETDGLALSSRNAYLSKDEREQAPVLYQTIRDMSAALAKGLTVDKTVAEGLHRLGVSGFRVDYLDVRHAETLEPVNGDVNAPARVFVAAFLGKTRLIDNVAVP